MFEKWRIKEHMEVTDAAGQHIGTVDSIDGDLVKLTRSDALDGRHHYLDLECVEKIDDNRVYLKAGVPLPEAFQQPETPLSPDSFAAGYEGQKPSPGAAQEDAPLFGTSGHGTGMGGSGTT